MEGLALIAVFVGISLLTRWIVAHDTAPDEPTRGLFAMREPQTEPVDVLDPRVPPPIRPEARSPRNTRQR